MTPQEQWREQEKVREYRKSQASREVRSALYRASSAEQREKLERDFEAFCAAGGVAEQVPSGVSGYMPRAIIRRQSARPGRSKGSKNV